MMATVAAKVIKTPIGIKDEIKIICDGPTSIEPTVEKKLYSCHLWC